MKVVYYDVLENLIKDIKKITNNVELDSMKHELIIEKQKVKYEEIDIDLRSFSKPFFVENEIELDLSECREDIKNQLIEISTAYTDNELEAIVHKMPILKDYSSKRNKDLKDVAIIWRDHFLEDNIGLLISFMRMGVKASDILVMDKGDSTKHRKEITATFEKLRFQVELLDNNSLEEKKLLEKGIEIIDKFITDRKDKKVLILDDGAIISKILINRKYDNVKAIVELTEMGLRRIKKLDIEELPYPVLNVAKTNLKKFITYKEISNTIFTRTIELLGDEKIAGRTLIQLGYGDLGETLAKRFRQYGVRVSIVDLDIMKLIEATEEGFITYKTLEEAMKYEKPFIIIGASGEQSISKKVVMMLEDECYVTAGATADLSVFKEFEKEGVKYKFIPKYGTQYEINGKKITVLGNGRSVNLFDSESIPNRAIDIFKAGTLVTANMAIQEEKILNKKLQLDIVNKWIEDSKILELYYDLYLAKKIEVYMEEKLKIEYTIISRGTEKYGSKGYMGISEVKKGKRYFVLSKHYEKEVQTLKDSFEFDDIYSIENITLSRFEIIPKITLDNKKDFINERIIICGLGNVGFASLIYLLDLGYKEIDILINNNEKYVNNAIMQLNQIYKAKINVVTTLSTYNTYIEATGKSNIIKEIIENITENSSIFLLGTPREGAYLMDPLEIHRKNINIFGGHELNGHSWQNRNSCFIDLLKKNRNKELKKFVNIYNEKTNIVNNVLQRKNNFFEVIKYDI